VTGIGLALAASAVAVALSVLWFETQPPARDRWPIGLALLCLALAGFACVVGFLAFATR
jgi:hypothetical protein